MVASVSYDELSGIDKRALQTIIILRTTTDHTHNKEKEMNDSVLCVKFYLFSWFGGSIWRLVGGRVQYLGEQ